MADLKCNTTRCSRCMMLTCLGTLAGVLAPLLFVLVMLVVQSFQPVYSPIRETISGLATGHYGWLQTLSFFLFGLLLAVFTFRLYITTERNTPSKVGAVAFFLSSPGFFPLGAFPPISDEFGVTLRGLLHTIAAIDVSSLFILGCFAFAAYFRTDSQWEKFWRYTAITAIASLVFFLLWMVAPAEWQLKGLSQRLMLVSGFLWLEIVSVRLLGACVKNKCDLNFPFYAHGRGGRI